jgi:hypothetical protein
MELKNMKTKQQRKDKLQIALPTARKERTVQPNKQDRKELQMKKFP